MKLKTNPKGQENDLVIQELKGELLIYDLSVHKAYCLNETSAIIWNLCDGNNSVSDIRQHLSRKLNKSVPEDLVWLALDQLKADDLLSESREVEIKFDGLSRREVIRKIGVASLVALPMVASLAAPTAAMAQSAATCGAIGDPCTGTIGTEGSCCSRITCCRDGAGVDTCRRRVRGPFGLICPP